MARAAAYRTLATLLFLAIGSGSASAGTGHCPSGGVCAQEEAVRASALLQVREAKRRTMDFQGREVLGERRMVKKSGDRILIDKSEEVVLNGALKPATASEKAEFLRVHNEYRCMHGSPPLTWSDAVAQNASDYADPLVSLTHSSSYSLTAPEGPAAENLYGSSAAAIPAQAVKLWYDEVDNCACGPTCFVDGCRTGVNNSVTGHFTALIWKGAKELGCAFSSTGLIAICRYKAGDTLTTDTPNVYSSGSGSGDSYVQQVPVRVKTLAECQGPAPAPTPAPPTPAPPTPAPGAVCVTGSGSGGCIMASSGCGGQVSFEFTCTSGGSNFQFTIGMPDNYVWDLSGHCPHCSNIVVH